MRRILPLFGLLALGVTRAFSAGAPVDKFQQLEQLLPSPNAQRNAAGAPGPAYWQNRADYRIEASLDEQTHQLTGRGTITYHNASPDTLTYLWLQLDANLFAHNSDARMLARPPADLTRVPYRTLQEMVTAESYSSDLVVNEVKDASGRILDHTVVKTMMRVDLPAPLAPGGKFTFSLGWRYRLNPAKGSASRTSYELFEKDGNALYVVAQWFPRLAAYTDYTGWQHKQYLGTGEFTLEFGNYDVQLTVPDDHVVASTGTLQNPAAVLTAAQRERLQQAETAKAPVFIVTPDEAKANESHRPAGTKTWNFRADNVRDFAFATSRKFIWDAMGASGHTHAGKPVLAMSFYPKEGMPLWDKYSTHAIAHTLDVYSRFSFPYPYPVAISVNGPVGGGMEYPMICFNRPRPEDDGTYAKRTKYGLIGVIIHEVGHNYFPMVVNSDERQWTWMDEGINSFLQQLAQEEWENNWPQRRDARELPTYMRRTDRVPVMSNSESIQDLGNNSYAQPAVALNILRDVVMGRALFDHAFKTYAQRWMFKRPVPADFFRTMEDASGVDLDWFWRGWFYSTDRVDLAIEQVRWIQLDSKDPAIEKPKSESEKKARPQTTTRALNAALPKRVDRFPDLKDFYDSYDEATVLPSEKKAHDTLVRELTKAKIDPALLKTARNFYLIDFANLGGLVMPLPLRIEYTDGTTEEMQLGAELWRYNTDKSSKLIMTAKEIRAVTLDPRDEMADCDLENNFWPRRPVKTKFQLFKEAEEKNPLRELTKPAAKDAATDAAKP
ncbi:M1 family metallopeptidase [Horticoccus sp. 23ND18S-11]|uniref:M1 family metallopeptidase n=1 Tax=Horticoccus sp. 23ND18S-11 TaxID=3391832 RepID=UPI0039C9BD1C